ncbi:MULTISPECIES: TetR/AcrR family transcriptional regulator [unclassified Streptomyces]|uniref:TetR/AcrR family transcriptional regulator n=1 Tax=unclassified Streptomyces TaxID=2593676 RepID=UPI0004C595E8|nr:MULTISPECIES: TetR/AcrR family transcriptional regulator [unclassified Streptomyces]
MSGADGTRSGADGERPDGDGGQPGADARADGSGPGVDRRPWAAERPRGRPRSREVERAIVDAVIRLLEEGTSIDGLSIERVARTAGVGKAAVYRRWSGKDELLLYVLRELEEPPYEGPTEGPVREILLGVLEWQRGIGVAKRRSTLLRTMAGHVKSHPRLWRQYHDTVVARRRAAMLEVLATAVASGELRDDLDPTVLADLITGPLLTRMVLRPWDDLPEDLPRQIVDGVLEGIRPQGRSELPPGTG